MKKVILIAAVLLVAIVGLTSYSGKVEKRPTSDKNLIASLNTGGGQAIGGAKKLE
ncbi:MAG: hypothetical protein PSV16_02115 [Flavobacterium sp.]|nr:hypothetical protein [Flavobacterium sp.]